MSELNYVFLSYSHRDDITNYISILDENGYNSIYDETLSYGEEWDLKVRRKISNPRCRGIFFFLSQKSVLSHSILTEIEYAIKYDKPYVAITLSADTPNDIFITAKANANEEERFIVDNIAEYFPQNKLFISKTNFNFDNSSKLPQTLSTWGMVSNKALLHEYTASTYTSKIMGERERLELQAEGYIDFDDRAIKSALDKIEGNDLVVLDIGCSDGLVTFSRFASCPRISKVIGIDYNKDDIEKARNNYKDNEKFFFYQADLESSSFVFDIKEILKEHSISAVDIVFGAFIMQHLQRPKLLLVRLFDILSPQGKVIIRESDDGCKVGYPNDTLIQEIIVRTNKLIKSSDRYLGRKLYTYFHDLGYDNIQIQYCTDDTLNKSRKEKEWLFTMGFSFRLNRIKSIYEENPENDILKKEIIWLEQSLEKLKESFFSRNNFYLVNAIIVIASA